MTIISSLITWLSTQPLTCTIIGWSIVLYFTVWKLGRKYVSWVRSPLNKLPGPKRSFLLGTFPQIMREPFMKPYTQWWNDAMNAEYLREDKCKSSTTEKDASDSSDAFFETKNRIDVPMLSYSTVLGSYAVVLLDPDIVKDVLGDSSHSKEHPRYVKKNQYVKYLMGEALFTLEGSDWSRHRRIVQPSFQTSVLEQTLDEFVPVFTQRLISAWKKQSDHGSIIDLDTHLQALTLDIIGQAGFSYSFDALHAVEQWSVATTSTSTDGTERNIDYNSLTWKDYITKMKPLGSVKIDHPFVVALKKRLVSPSLLDFVCLSIQMPRLIPYIRPSILRNQRKLDLAAETVVHEAREKLKTQGDTKSKSLLQLLLNATDHSEATMSATTSKRNSLSITELRDEVKSFLIAGHETTSTWCYWALYALSKDQVMQERVYQDVTTHAVKRTNDTIDHQGIGLAEVNQMEYLAAFLNEVLRFYPPVGLLLRYNTKEESFKGQTIPINTRICIPIHLIHRHPKYWGCDANVFRPERWIEQKLETRHPFCFLPFSAGGRSCVGYRFSTIETKLILANIINAFVIQPAPCMRDTIELVSAMTLKSKPLVKICVKPRISK